jgi:hypothetical protein
MTLVRVVFLMAAFVLSGLAADVEGRWKVKFLGDPETWPKMVSEITFNFIAQGKQLTGMAHMASWPGDAPISDGEIHRDQISFVVVGKSPWKSRGPRGESSGYPRLTFSGVIQGNEIKMHLLWDSVLIYGDVSNSGREYDMAGGRIATTGDKDRVELAAGTAAQKNTF